LIDIDSIFLPWRRIPDGNLDPSELGATCLYHFPEEKSWAIPNLNEVFPLVLAVQGAHARKFIALSLSE
jgi:hypothetical protein